MQFSAPKRGALKTESRRPEPLAPQRRRGTIPVSRRTHSAAATENATEHCGQNPLLRKLTVNKIAQNDFGDDTASDRQQRSLIAFQYAIGELADHQDQRDQQRSHIAAVNGNAPGAALSGVASSKGHSISGACVPWQG